MKFCTGCIHQVAGNLAGILCSHPEVVSVVGDVLVLREHRGELSKEAPDWCPVPNAVVPFGKGASS